MKTLILSDLHLGNGGAYDIFAGAEALPALLASQRGAPLRVILNGDAVDFLLNDDPLQLDVARAVAQAEAICEAEATRPTLAALGEVLAAGGEVVFRIGNHDVELALPDVQNVFRRSLGRRPDISARLSFQLGDRPEILDVGGARMLVSHGNHCDGMNEVEYTELLDGQAAIVPGHFDYPPGSRLVKELLNPLKRDHLMRYMDLLKPDFRGAVMTALAVNPGAAKVALRGASLEIGWSYLKNSVLRGARGIVFGPQEEDELGLTQRIADAGLFEDELAALEGTLGSSSRGIAFGEDDALARARIKLLRTGLAVYARVHRMVAGMGISHFDLMPGADEAAEVRRLTEKYGASAVITGHTHAARWLAEPGLTFVNTGTWIWLMRMPAENATADEWMAFLEELAENPTLDPERQLFAQTEARFHFALVEPRERGGAMLRLAQWTVDGRLLPQGEAQLEPCRRG